MIMNKRNYWGPLLWETINVIIREYPESPSSENRQNYKLFFQSLGDVLPCPNCRQHYAGHLRKMSLDAALETKSTLIDFIIDLHNEVNKATGKAIMNKETARSIVNGTYTPINNNTICIIAVLIVLGSGFLFIKRK